MLTKSSLAINLSGLKTYESPFQYLEQYSTDSESAATALWAAFMAGDIEGKVVGDLGCGTGILSIGAALLGAKKVIGIDIDNKAIDIAKENAKKYDLKIAFIEQDIVNFDSKADTIVANPPFGFQKKGKDRPFLHFAAQAEHAWIINQNVTKDFVKKFMEMHGSKFLGETKLSLELKQTQKHHKRRMHRVDAVAMRFENI